MSSPFSSLSDNRRFACDKERYKDNFSSGSTVIYTRLLGDFVVLWQPNRHLDIHKYKDVSLSDLEFYDFSLSNSSDTRLIQSVSRSRRLIMSYALSNDIWSYFVTLTFDDSKINSLCLSASDPISIWKSLQSFFDNYRKRKNPDFRYLLVIEFQKSGRVHYHGLFTEIPKVDLFELSPGIFRFEPFFKKYGASRLEKIRTFLGVSQYITKYCTKESVSTCSQLGKQAHIFYHSQGLNSGKNLGCVDYSALSSSDFDLISSCPSISSWSNDFGRKYILSVEDYEKFFKKGLVYPDVFSDNN